MKIITIILFFIFYNNFLINCQSWIVESPGKSNVERFSNPIELENGNIFCIFNSFDQLNTGTNDSFQVLLQIRNSKGWLLNERKITSDSSKIFPIESSLFNNGIFTIYKEINSISNVINVKIQLLSDKFDTLFEELIYSDTLNFISSDIYIESDTTILVFLNYDQTNKFFRISNSGKVLDFKSFFDNSDYITNITEKYSNDTIVALGELSAMYLDKKFNLIYHKDFPFFLTDGWGSLTKYKMKSYLWLKAYNNGTLADIGLVRFNSEFDTIKTVRIGNPLEIELAGLGFMTSIASNNSIYMVGIPFSPPLALVNVPIIITKLDSNLNVIWTKYYDNGEWNGVPEFCASSNGGIIIAGFKRNISEPYLNQTSFLMKIDSSGNFPTEALNENKSMPLSAVIYPNPSTNNFSVKFNQFISNVRLCFYNQSNVLVFQKDLNQLDQYNLNLNFLPCGLYYYVLKWKDKELITGKWIKL